MPGVGHQHAGANFFSHVQHVAKQQFLGHQRAQRHPQGQALHGWEVLGRCGQLVHGLPEHAGAHEQQHQAHGEGCCRLETLVTILVVVVGSLVAVAVGQQHHEVGQQVGQGVDAIGHQSLGVAPHPGDDLNHGEHQVDHHTDQGAATGHCLATCRVLFVVVFGQSNGFWHGGQCLERLCSHCRAFPARWACLSARPGLDGKRLNPG